MVDSNLIAGSLKRTFKYVPFEDLKSEVDCCLLENADKSEGYKFITAKHRAFDFAVKEQGSVLDSRSDALEWVAGGYHDRESASVMMLDCSLSLSGDAYELVRRITTGSIDAGSYHSMRHIRIQLEEEGWTRYKAEMALNEVREFWRDYVA